MRKKIIYKTLFIISTFLFAVSAKAATLSVNPSKPEVEVGQTVSLTIIASSTEAINVVAGQINFDATKVKIASISKAGSIVNFWIQEPSADSGLSSAHFEGVILNPGYKGGAGQVIRINFTALKEGNARFSLSAAQVLANDGVGTNVLSGVSGSSITIIPKKDVPEPDKQPITVPQQPTEVPPILPGDLPAISPEPVVPFVIVDYPREVEVGETLTVHGKGGDSPITVYAVEADPPGVFSGNITYQNLTMGGYTIRAQSVVSGHSFVAQLKGLKAGRYAVYAKDDNGEVTSILFVTVSQHRWSNSGIASIPWFWVVLGAITLSFVAWIFWVLGERYQSRNY